MAKKRTTYEQLVEHNPKIADILDPKAYEFVQNTNERTIAQLDSVWKKNAKKNLRGAFQKYGLLVDNCRGFGFNKATVMIGAGPSLKKNWEYLKRLCWYNSGFGFDEQAFIFVASNHQYKKCIEAGIIPHFVILVDASDSDAIYQQLCVDIPPKGQSTALIAAIHCAPRIIDEWTRQGRMAQFYIPDDPENLKLAKRITGKDFAKKAMLQGGNVSNVAWLASLAAFDSRIFISLGNDLSYDLCDDIKKRREGYYMDGNYASNLASGRDEAKGIKKWIGFDLYQSIVMDGQSHLKFVPKGTTGSLFTYKTWLETFVAIQDVSPSSFHYYNCSEGGILGVVPKSYATPDLDNVNNWLLLDHILPRRWHTRTFKDAAEILLAAREKCLKKGAISIGVDRAITLPGRTVGAKRIAPQLMSA